MRKIRYTLIATIILILTYGVIKELTYNPLGVKEFNKLFPYHGNNINCIYHKDFLGWGYRDYFDYFIYQVDTVCIDSKYPKWDQGWGDLSFSTMTNKTKWIQCPIAEDVFSKYSLELNETTKNQIPKKFHLKEKLEDRNNYYCYLYVNNLEKFFFSVQSFRQKIILHSAKRILIERVAY